MGLRLLQMMSCKQSKVAVSARQTLQLSLFHAKLRRYCQSLHKASSSHPTSPTRAAHGAFTATAQGTQRVRSQSVSLIGSSSKGLADIAFVVKICL